MAAPLCMIEVRKRDGEIEGVCMGCKAVDACLNQKAENFPVGRYPWQCLPTRTSGPSVCRQCCNTAECTTDFLPTYDDNWITWNQDLVVLPNTYVPVVV